MIIKFANNQLLLYNEIGNLNCMTIKLIAERKPMGLV